MYNHASCQGNTRNSVLTDRQQHFLYACLYSAFRERERERETATFPVCMPLFGIQRERERERESNIFVCMPLFGSHM